MFTFVNYSLFTFVIQNLGMTFGALISSWFDSYKASELSHRYITNSHIEPLLNSLPDFCSVKMIGRSVNALPIYHVNLGSGSTRVLMWSQMHGNESTTTKAVFDLINLLDTEVFSYLLDHITISIVPILNPDGALAYTRMNANDTDLNRDAQILSQPESLVLKGLAEKFDPHFAFNLHGQRTIFSAGDTNNPATLSFLAPAADESLSITESRKQAMHVIAKMNEELQRLIPNQVGIYDDAFNLNCVGDTFQAKGIPTILFEAGHYPSDYGREETRRYMVIALLTALTEIAKPTNHKTSIEDYQAIPENQKRFYDIILRNANNGSNNLVDIALQYQEVLEQDHIEFIPKVEKIESHLDFYAHKEIDLQGGKVVTTEGEEIEIGYDKDFVVKSELLSQKLTDC